MKIDSFSGQYSFLSNFAPCRVMLGNVPYPTVEHAYQAAKFTQDPLRQVIRETPAPGDAKRLARKLSPMRPDWEQVKVTVMERLLEQKFSQPEFRAKLLATGEAELVEGNTWGDTFWGVYQGQGQNMLGQLLMKLRGELLRQERALHPESAPLTLPPLRPQRIIPTLSLTGKVYAATGHRLDKLSPMNKDLAYSIEFLEQLTRFAQTILQKDRPDSAISGMALGWDTAWAIAAIREGVPLIAAVPFDGQESRWPAQSQARYHKILAKAQQVVTIGEAYSRETMQARNEWMVDNASLMVALWNGSQGGTRNCVVYAQKVARPLRNYWGRWISTLTQWQSSSTVGA
jgi:ribA/ribD-fused uncharacterized protein